MDTPTRRSTQPPRVQQKYNNSNTYCSIAVVGQPSTQKKENIHQQPSNPQCVYDNSTTAVQQYSRKYAELCQGWGRVYGGQKTKKNKKNCSSGTPNHTTERGRSGGLCLSIPLHAPRSPSTCTAVDVYSRTYHTAAHALVQSLFLCRAGMWGSATCTLCWYPGTAVLGLQQYTYSRTCVGAC